MRFRFIHQLHSTNKAFRGQIQTLILSANKELLQQISINPIGNFILQVSERVFCVKYALARSSGYYNVERKLVSRALRCGAR